MPVARHPALQELADQPLALTCHRDHIAGEFFVVDLGEIVGERLGGH